jgi:hypothetical protein
MTDTVSVRRAAAGDVDDIVAIYVNSANAHLAITSRRCTLPNGV